MKSIFSILNETYGRGAHTTKLGLYAPPFGTEASFGQSQSAPLDEILIFSTSLLILAWCSWSWSSNVLTALLEGHILFRVIKSHLKLLVKNMQWLINWWKVHLKIILSAVMMLWVTVRHWGQNMNQKCEKNYHNWKQNK